MLGLRQEHHSSFVARAVRRHREAVEVLAVGVPSTDLGDATDREVKLGERRPHAQPLPSGSPVAAMASSSSSDGQASTVSRSGTGRGKAPAGAGTADGEPSVSSAARAARSAQRFVW
jgi:hypothetical protein